ncbi:MAG: peptide ABC transporter ATP-binding protein [Rhodospirillaceae bacterium]|nr:peptide ABC transporter ATP-binding protein [Rhodospirillaceae bacterium]|tara:strand:- start:404 stop:1417 length:1014 start_codon:yes stop_codon:yes gene_type:complete
MTLQTEMENRDIGNLDNEVILNVKDVVVQFPRPKKKTPFNAVNGVSFELRKGETLGLVGESGSGKSMTALSLLGLVPVPGRIIEGSINLRDRRIDNLPINELRKVRGNDLGMVFQDPMTGLNPVRNIGSQLCESVIRHQNVSKSEALEIAFQALDDVGIPSARDRLEAFPHELSGGLRQRVMIALALINHPEVIIADEATTALDATIQAQILDLFRERLANATMILITHDMGVAAEICDRIAVMYAGRIVETGTIEEVLSSPRHPYTMGLLSAVPRFDIRRPKLVPIPGQPPTAEDIVQGCAFSSRCKFTKENCAERPLLEKRDNRQVACWFPKGEV